MIRRLLLRNFRDVYRTDRWFRRRFTKPGFVVLYALLAAGVLGFNMRLNLASQIFTFLVALLCVGAAANLFFRPRLRLSRTLPPFVTVGEAAYHTVRVENRGGRRAQGLWLADELINELPSYEEYVGRRDPADRDRNRFDRYVGYPRWVWLAKQKLGGTVAPAPVPVLAAGHSVEVRVRVEPRRRGHLRFRGYTVSRADPFGLVNGLRRYTDPGRLLVLPRRYPVPRLELPGTRQHQVGDVTLLTATGDSHEFVSLRDYRPGDSPRDIHWRSWAKIGRPVIKEHRPEYFVRNALVLDTFPALGQEAAFEEAVSVAASFLCTLEDQENLLDLIFIGPRPYRFTAGRGHASTAGLLEVLACVQGRPEEPFASLSEAVVPWAAQFSGCVAVLLGWDAPRRALVRSLRQRNVATCALVIAAADALDVVPGEDADFIHLPPDKVAQKLKEL